MTASRSSSKPAPRQNLGLLDAFRDLYAEAAREVRALAGPEPPDPEAVKQRLLKQLARQAKGAGERLAEHELGEFEEAQYVMVAMADEIFLHLSWSGRDAWAARPLEAERPQGSHVAGERIFQRIEDFISGRASASGELLSVYIAALCLGFRGRYRFNLRSTEPEHYRRELVKHLCRVDPAMLVPSPEICPEAHEHTRDKEPRQGLRSMREGVLPLLATAVAMMFVGHIFWYARTIEVREQLDRIEEVREQLDRGGGREQGSRQGEPPRSAP
jgi:type VI secretion system protein ImpK